LRPLKKNLVGKRFAADSDMKQAVTSWQESQGNDFLYGGIQVLTPRLDKCFNVSDDYEDV